MKKFVINLIEPSSKIDDFFNENDFKVIDIKNTKNIEGPIICLVKNLNKNNYENIKNTFSKTNKVFFLSSEDSSINKNDNWSFNINYPIKINKLIDIINSKAHDEPIIFHDLLILDNFIINSETKEKIRITETETKIIEKLIKNKKLEKKFLQSEVLNLKKEIDTKSIESHISRIRKKIKLIKTNIKIKIQSDEITIS